MLKKLDLTSVITFLIGLAIVATWVSQSVLDFATGLIAVLAVVSLFRAETRAELFSNSNLNRVFPWMAVYFVVACLGYYFNGRPEADVLFCLTRFSWILLLYTLAWGFRYFDENRPSLKWFFYLLLIPALYGFNIFFNSNGTDWLKGKFADGRIIGLVQSATYHSHIGGFLAVVLICWLHLKYFESYKKSFFSSLFSQKTLHWLVALIVFLSVLFSQTRGALLSIIVALGIFFLVKHGWGFVKWVVAPLMVLAVFLYFKIPVMDYLVRKDGDGCRKLLALVHVEMVKTHPLLGIGYRDNMRQIADYWPEHLRSPNCEWARVEGSQAHNQILNVAGTTGLLGLFSYLGIVIWFFILNIRWYRQDRSDLALVCLIAQIYFQMSCLTEISFEFAKIRVLVLMVWALVVVRAPFTSRPKAS
ncbi:MAG: hypothetical protein K0R29_1522 [Pseudobdellovibrio sp.]|jgi:O-antigen ligase|nr:hypothetical protein [Pseudobdellovibrio sp.]